MAMTTIFIDGEAGTTGLLIHERLRGRGDMDFIHLDERTRKDPATRKDALNSADLVILCLPDAAAINAVSLIENPAVRVIDASSAHRTAPGWVYGMAEYTPDHATVIAQATRVSNPGCYACAAVALLYPLVQRGIMPATHPVTINAISGYSGGGKAMIAAFEDPDSADYTTEPFRVYGLTLDHKHVPEIHHWSGLTRRPLFVPSVGRFRQGMIVQIPVPLCLLNDVTATDIRTALEAHYAGQRFVRVADAEESAARTTLAPEGVGTNDLCLHVFADGAGEQALLVALLDNLGKGASAQAVQNLNLMLGHPEDTGL